MMITKKSLPRRTVLRGVGATLALAAARRHGAGPDRDEPDRGRTGAAARRRLRAERHRHGAVDAARRRRRLRDHADSQAAGAVPRPLARGVGNFSNKGARQHPRDPAPPASSPACPPSAPRARSSGPASRWTSSWRARRAGTPSSRRSSSPSSRATTWAPAGAATPAPTPTPICWRSATTPLPMETNPRTVFERLLGDTGGTDPAARLARIEQNRSLLDAVTDKVAQLRRDLGPPRPAQARRVPSTRCATSSAAFSRPRPRSTSRCPTSRPRWGCPRRSTSTRS